LQAVLVALKRGIIEGVIRFKNVKYIYLTVDKKMVGFEVFK
jgi:hypothetical protein